MSNVIAKKELDVPLSEAGIHEAIRWLETRKIVFEICCKSYRKAVAAKIMEIAEQLYASAWYNDLVDGGQQPAPAIPMDIKETEEETILVAGGAAIFIEFGAGVHHNTSVGSSQHPYGVELGFTIGSYPPAPSKGQFDSWNGTYGTQAQMVLYRAVRMVEPYLEDIAKEVFGQ